MTAAGPGFAITTTAPVDVQATDFTLLGLTLFSWVYAEAAVDIATPEGGCTAAGFDFQIDLQLEAGWNQVAAAFTGDAGTDAVTDVSFTNGSSEELYFNLLF